KLAGVLGREIRGYGARLDEDPAAPGEAPREGHAPGLDAGLQGADDEVPQRDVTRAHLKFDLPRLGTDVVDDDVASGGGDRHVAAGVSHRNVAGLGQDLQIAGESTHLDVSGAGLALPGAARRH